MYLVYWTCRPVYESQEKIGRPVFPSNRRRIRIVWRFGLPGTALKRKDSEMMKSVFWSEYSSPVGRLTLASDGERLTGLWIEGQKYFGGGILNGKLPKSVRPENTVPDNVRPGNTVPDNAIPGNAAAGNEIPGIVTPDGVKRDDRLAIFAQTKCWLDRYFAGERPAPGELPLAPEGGEFRQIVWRLLCEIPYGETTTYGALAVQAAAELGRPSMSAQAVGGAVGHNPISIVIPCHRVLGVNGSLTGYAGGLEAKRYLLRLEGIPDVHK